MADNIPPKKYHITLNSYCFRSIILLELDPPFDYSSTDVTEMNLTKHLPDKCQKVQKPDSINKVFFLPP